MLAFNVGNVVFLQTLYKGKDEGIVCCRDLMSIQVRMLMSAESPSSQCNWTSQTYGISKVSDLSSCSQ